MDETRRPPLDKPRFTLRLKLTLGLTLIIGIIFLALNLFNLLSHRRAMESEALLNRAIVTRLVFSALTGQLASYELDSTTIRIFLKNFLTAAIIQNERTSDLAFGLVVDDKNRLIAGRAKPDIIAFPPGTPRPQEERAVLEAIAKLDGRLGAHMRTSRVTIKLPGRGGDVGKLMVGTSLARLEREFRRSLTINLTVFVAMLVSLFLYAALTLRHLVTAPIAMVMKAMRAVHQGDFSQEITLARRDEIGILANTYNFMVRGLRERDQLKDAFSRYVSSQVFERINLGDINLTGELRQATVLFSDIRSFTALSERLPPSDVVRLLNDYFNVMVGIVFTNEGFLNKFIGDALMAVYNVPIDQTQPEMRAVRTALQMIQALEEFNKQRAARGEFSIKIGIGINTGPVIAGNIGHVRRLEYTVIGDTVNLAQRIESQTKVTGMPILISDTTYRAVAHSVLAQALPPVKVKGKQDAVTLHAVTGLRDATQAEAVVVTEPIPIPQTS